MVLDGVMPLWFTMTALSVVFVAFDIIHAPESPALKRAFVLTVLHIGPIGLSLCLPGCREPLDEPVSSSHGR